MASKNSKLESLSKILAREATAGFQDSTVIGGLDRFLQRCSDEVKIVTGELASYSLLTPIQRQIWSEQVLSKLDKMTPKIRKRTTNERSQDTLSPTGSSPKKTDNKVPCALSDSVLRIKGVSDHNQSKLKRLGIETVEDLLYHFPNRHNDFANIRKVSALEFGEEQTVVVNVWEATETRQGVKRRSTQAVLGDDTGNVRAIWFNNPYLAKTLRSGIQLVVSGKVNVYKGNFVFESPEYEILRDQEDLIHTGRLVPVYPTIDGLPARTLRRIAKAALDVGVSNLVEYMPEGILQKASLMGLRSAIEQVHYPDTAVDWAAARRRLAFDELFMLQIAVLRRKNTWQQEDMGIPLKVDQPLLDGFESELPFELTSAQSRVLSEILDDLEKVSPMSRLLQGDVGSGKTVVATAAMLVAAFNNYQAAIIAPTELLAEQHFMTITNLLSPVSSLIPDDDVVSIEIKGHSRPITLALLIGSMSKRRKSEVHKRIADGEVDIVIGTHAVIQKEVELPYLAVAVVDEQHRFGVMQRALIRSKGKHPHLLAMSATPIPRSLALTFYGELDISVIDQMPPNRLAVRTRRVEPDKRSAAYGFIRKEIEEGRQAFVVCPLIETSDALQTRAATEEYERLSTEVFPDLRLGLLHGRLALREKELVMERFQHQELDILISTPVVEVGIDVPNATVMLVDGADRFGLSQIHQFRGRVGRGSHQSYCLLLADSPGEDARERLKIAERLNDGFELAEEDLRIRGPGDYLGTRQSGLPNLKIAQITDNELLTIARQEALRILDSDPGLNEEENAGLANKLELYTGNLSGEMS